MDHDLQSREAYAFWKIYSRLLSGFAIDSLGAVAIAAAMAVSLTLDSYCFCIVDGEGPLIVYLYFKGSCLSKRVGDE
jgi:hypothetical protein